MVKYRLNLIKAIRKTEKLNAAHKARLGLMLLVCFSVPLIIAAYAYFRVSEMQAALARERAEIRRLENEYRQYESTSQTPIGKEDLELLNDLLGRRVYWTRILDAMARHLPHEEPTSYWITKFGYRPQPRRFDVSGFGYITDRQEQLLELDTYIRKLRADTNYAEVFANTFLGQVRRSDETVGQTQSRVERVSFEYTSIRAGGQR